MDKWDTSDADPENLFRACRVHGIDPREMLEALSRADGEEASATAILAMLGEHGVDPAAFFATLVRGDIGDESTRATDFLAGGESSRRSIRDEPKDRHEFIQQRQSVSVSSKFTAAQAIAARAVGGHSYFRGRNAGTYVNLGLIEVLLLSVGEARLDASLRDSDKKRRLSWTEWFVSVSPRLGSIGLVDEDAPTLQDAERESFDSARQRLRAAAFATRADDVRSYAGILLEACSYVARAEEAGEANREAMTDLLLHLLDRVEGLNRGHENYADFVVMLYRMMEFDLRTEVLPTLGAMQSLAGTGDLAGHFRARPEFLHLAVAIYGTLLEDLAARGDANNANSELWNRARIGANNISGHLSSLNKLDSGVSPFLPPDLRKVAELVNRMQVVSACGAALTTQPSSPASSEVWRMLGFDVERLRGGDSADDQLSRIEALVRSMNNVLTGWAYLDPLLYTPDDGNLAHGYLGDNTLLMVAFLGSLLRAGYAQAENKGLDEPASSLFNAGLSIERLRVVGPGNKSQVFLECSLPFYGAGACWALTRAHDLRQALIGFHGESCLVNLLGSLARLPIARGVALRDRLDDLASTLTRERAEQCMRPENWRRVRNALAEMLGESRLSQAEQRTRAVSTSPELLGRHVTALLVEVLKGTELGELTLSEGNAHTWGGGSDFVAETAQVLRRAVERVAVAMHSTYTRGVDYVDAGATEARTTLDATEAYVVLQKRVEDLLFRTGALLRQPILLRQLIFPPAVDTEHEGSPVSVLAQTLTGTSLGAAISHQRERIRPAEDRNKHLPSSYNDWFRRPGTFAWLPGIRLRSEA